MNDLSPSALKQNCPHCDFNSYAYHYILEETPNFHIVCDVHPVEKGHILVIPKQHLSCVGVFPPHIYDEFVGLYDKVSNFVETEFGSVATFEHGVFGQSVFHSHVHFLPFEGTLEDVIHEGIGECTPLGNISDLQGQYKENKGYLFLSIGDKMWAVNTALTQPGFFRYRFAEAIGHPERGNWKDMHESSEVMKLAGQEDRDVQAAWKKHFDQD